MKDEVSWYQKLAAAAVERRRAEPDLAEKLPRRVAHATFALLEASRELQMPPTAAEVCLYDNPADALSVRHTGAALREAAKRGLCAGWAGVWTATPLAHEFQTALEDRFLRDTEE